MARKQELDAMGSVLKALEKLDEDERGRVLRWAVEAFRTSSVPTAAPSSRAIVPGATASSFETIGALFDAAQPESAPERILTVMYWLSVVKSAEDVSAFDVHEELKQQGHRVANITVSLGLLMARSPSLVRQTRKQGRARQARKRYALTDSGRRAVENLIDRAREKGAP